MKGQEGNTDESGAGHGLSPLQIMGGARAEGVLSFRRCDSSHEVRPGGSPAGVHLGSGWMARLRTVAPGGRDEAEAAPRRPAPELGAGRSTLGSGLRLEGLELGNRSENLRPRKTRAPRRTRVPGGPLGQREGGGADSA